MSQPSIMFVAGEIKQKLLRKFSEFFFVSPFILRFIYFSFLISKLCIFAKNANKKKDPWTTVFKREMNKDSSKAQQIPACCKYHEQQVSCKNKQLILANMI